MDQLQDDPPLFRIILRIEIGNAFRNSELNTLVNEQGRVSAIVNE